MSVGIMSCSPVNYGIRQTSRSYSAYMKGLLTDRMGSFEEATAYYRKAQSLDQESPSPHVQLGLQDIGRRNFERAALEFRAAVRLAPEDEQARYVLALVYAQLNDYKKAAGEYEILLQKSAASLPRETQLRRTLSQLYFLDGDFASAKRQTEKILQLNPLDQDALYFMGLVASEEGRDGEAVAFFKKVLAYYPDDMDAANSLAFQYARQGEHLPEALDLALRTTGDDASNGAYLDTLGWVYFQLGDFEKAAAILERASKLLLDPVIVNHLAACYEKMGDNDKAGQYWEMSLALDPFQQDVRLKLKNLKP